MSRTIKGIIQSERTVMKIATNMVDQVTSTLLSEIKMGNLVVDDTERELKIAKTHRQNEGKQEEKAKSHRAKSSFNMGAQNVDMEEHKRLVQKFISQNKRNRRKREMKSVQMSQKSLKLRQQQQKSKEQQLSTIIQQRRREIEKRMQAKKNLLKEIQRMAVESNAAYSTVKKKKFLYQEKEEQFYKKVILPKIEQQKQILQTKKKLMRQPMDIQQILHHQKSYETLKMNSRVNRSLTISVMKSHQNEYTPPQFVPQSYKKAQEEKEKQRLEQELRKKQTQINQLRKREFVRKINEVRELERSLEKDSSSFADSRHKQERQKQKSKPSRQQVKNIGNDYLRELISNNKKHATARKLKPMATTMIESLNALTPDKNRKHRSQYEIEIIKEERISRVHKIRHKKINEIFNDKKLDQHTRQEKLLYEIQKLDQQAQQKAMVKQDIETINESASIMMNSIHAKLALLGVEAPAQV